MPEPSAKFKRTDITGFRIASAAKKSVREVLVGASFRAREKSIAVPVGSPSGSRIHSGSGTFSGTRIQYV
jgi:hypothetical protein